MSDSFSDGRSFRVLNIIDDYNRELLCCQGSLSFPSERVVRELQAFIELRGKPSHIRTDNGPEFISKYYKTWCEENGIIPVYATPGRPMENGYVERFNRTFREDVLDAYLMESLKSYQGIADNWMHEYNNYYPHESLEQKSPIEFAEKPPNPLVVQPKGWGA